MKTQFVSDFSATELVSLLKVSYPIFRLFPIIHFLHSDLLTGFFTIFKVKYFIIKMYSFYTLKRFCEKSLELKFISKIQDKNVQGSCGIMKYDKDYKLTNDESEEIIDCRELIAPYKSDTVFYKYGKNSCTLARQEFIVSNQLLMKCSHFPNFLRPIAYTKNHFIDNNSKFNPFFGASKLPKSSFSCVDVIIFEYLDEITPLWTVLKKNGISKTFLNSIVLQICLAILCAQKAIGFVHNDLHANNIVLYKCCKDLKILYRLMLNGKERFFLAPTMGYIPIIIDYGFSFSSDCENMNLESCDSDNYGLITYQSDEISDFIRFFTILYCSGYNLQLKSRILNLYSGLPISLKNSWEKIVTKHSNWYFENTFRKINQKYGFFHKSEKMLQEQIIKLFPRIITLPLKFHDTGLRSEDLEFHLTEFLLQWNNICMLLKHDHEKIFIFRELIDSIRKYSRNYDYIASIIFDKIYSVTGLEVPIKIDWKKLINYAIDSSIITENNLYTKTKNLEYLRNTHLKSKLISADFMFESIYDLIYKKPELYKNDYVVLIDDIDKINCLKKLDCDVKSFTEEELYRNLFL